MSPQRIQRRRVKGWRMPAGAVYVGRGAKWGNPFRGARGDSADAVALFRDMIQRAPLDDKGRSLSETIPLELAGKDLACWCPLDQPCHADVLLELANPGACDCGHGQDVHFIPDGCMDKSGGGYFCPCQEFKAENVKNLHNQECAQ